MCVLMDLSKAFDKIDHKLGSREQAKLVQFQDPSVK